MSDLKISQLPTAATLADHNEIPLNQDGVTKKATLATLNAESGLTDHLADVNIHAELDDTATAADKVWSSTKISNELAAKSATTHTHNNGDGLTGVVPYNKGGTGLSSISANKLLGAATANTIAEIGLASSLAIATGSLGVVADTTVQQGRISKAGVLVGTRRELNLIEGTNIALTVADNSGSNRVDVTAAFNSPLTTNGDLMVRTAGSLARLGVGSDGQVLTVVSGAPAWGTASSGIFVPLYDSGNISAGTSRVLFNSSYFTSTYVKFFIHVFNLLPTTDAVNALLRGYTDGGTTPLATAIHDYMNNGRNTADASKTLSAAGGSAGLIIHTSDTIGNAANEGISGVIEIDVPWSSAFKVVRWLTDHMNTSTVQQDTKGGGCFRTTTAMNNFALEFSGGSTIASGRVVLVGMKPS